MSLWKIAWRSIEQRYLASALTAFAMGLGVALVVAVLVIYGVIDQSFKRGSQGYDLIVGPKGSPLELVLNTVFHLGESPGTIPYPFYEELKGGRLSSAVETVVPVCMGHAYNDMPVIATLPEMFSKLKYLDDREYKFAQGENLNRKNPFEAVIGSVAAKKTKLKVGDTFKPAHPTPPGQEKKEDKEKEEADKDNKHHEFKVVGVLEHTGTPNDRAIFINLEGFYRLGCHAVGPTTAQSFLSKKDDKDNESSADTPVSTADAEDHSDHAHEEDAGIPLEDRKISAILVCTDQSRPRLAMALPGVIDDEPDVQAVRPAREIAKLFEGIVGNVQLLLLILAVLVVVVAGIGILVSIYNSMSDRRHEIAIMRALGASRMHVGMIILLESILLSLGGGAIGLILGHGLVGILGPTIAEQTGVIVQAYQFQAQELIIIPGLIVLASIVGYLPAAVAYRTDVAKSLTAGK